MNNRMNNRNENTAAGTTHLVAFASGKGGVGKSVIAFNLARKLSETHRVLLVDGDFQMSNLHLLANTAPRYGWQDVCANTISLADAVISTGNNLYLLSSGGAESGAALPEMEALAQSLKALRGSGPHFDFIIFDTGASILPHTNIIFGGVDEVILVATPELTAISDCYAMFKVLVSNFNHLKISLLINQENRQEKVDYIYTKFAALGNHFLGQAPALFGCLGHHRNFIEAVASQRSVIDLDPQAEAAKQLTDLAQNLIGNQVNTRFEVKNLNSEPVAADIKE